MRLIYEKSGDEVCVGDHAHTFRGELVQVERIEKPRDPQSTGRVYCRYIVHGLPHGAEMGWYPSVICAKWDDRND